MYYQKCTDTKSHIHIALLQIRWTPLWSGLPKPATLLFNHPVRGIMPIINRPLIKSSNDGYHYEEWLKRQMKNDKSHDASRNYASIPIGCVVVVQWEEDGPWTHGTVEGKGDHNRNRYYTIHITKTAQHITRNSKHVKTTPITPDNMYRTS